MVRRRVTMLLAVLIALSACSGQDIVIWPPAGSNTAPAGTVVALPDVLKLGESAEITGEKGHPLTVTPVGVYFYRGRVGDRTLPVEKWFAAVAIRVEGADRMPPDAVGQWFVRHGTRFFGTSSGNSDVAPWVGSTNAGMTPVAPGAPEVAIKTFDVPKGGGQLQWTSMEEPPVRWQLPGRTAGEGLDEVVTFMKNR
ncbi:hypothetical protein [Acrocarpospora sp. B8E8]|uniref:hypothetical protein n=1 Tax=Acrocarpospora sp. B8E8 TaxID=3153572 RepID=UPI00325F4239